MVGAFNQREYCIWMPAARQGLNLFGSTSLRALQVKKLALTLMLLGTYHNRENYKKKVREKESKKRKKGSYRGDASLCCQLLF